MLEGQARGQETNIRMTDEQRDPEAGGPEDAADPETAADAVASEADDETLTEAALDQLDAQEDRPVDRAAATTAETAGRRRPRGTAGRTGPAPTIADEAVHVQDRVSGYFVIATVGVFVLILAWALLLGRNGMLSDVFATPKPIPTPVASVAPSVVPSVAPSVVPSVVPSAAPESPSPSAS